MKITPVQLARRVEHWQKILAPLGVGHFRVDRVTTCDTTSGDSAAIATIRTSPHYDSVVFEFTYGFLDEADSRRLDEVIVHEWLHPIFRDHDEAARVVKSWMPEATYEDWFDRIEHEQEGIIERVARFIVDLHYAAKA